MIVGDNMKWGEMSRKAKIARIEKTFEAIDENEPCANFLEYFAEINPDVEITEKELYQFLEEEYGGDNEEN